VTPDRMPAFLLDTEDGMVYGLPDICGSGVKVGWHHGEGVLDGPDDARPAASEAEMAALQDVLKRYAWAAAGAPRRSKSCVYTRTPEENFILGLHPQAPQIVLASPCSGHGFKFASLIGEVLADLATERTTNHPIQLFTPDRFLS
jgi:sarcosine oxidase